ncbi:hypothetical protein ABOM_005662 [Aspergillus bombycis]|uniref:Uncharacterized protein n=1 Tax=Aspergillus bombycis TaxID=109264 RepID=A0A1F8A2Y9_9EURO|nr:hypothetical protein ABOM_005662 [Aspergillus bombycis]OGM46074.1 hypothetical protein ABOM_005662 [Aspergillus bombycis]
MSGVKKRLPRDIKQWEDAMARMNLTGQTVHGAKLASASKVEQEQFLLFHVLWVPRPIDELLRILSGISEWISEADTMLGGYKSWGTYCRAFFSPNIEEGNFAVARQYQLEVTDTQDDTDLQTFVTPIAHRTRARARERGNPAVGAHVETPSKSTNISEVLSLEDISLDDPFVVQETSVLETPVHETPVHETPSPFQPITPGPKELENVLYPPTKDEQIVNCALILFLNALTMHFKLTNKWTLHRKAFKANFEEASFEARIDGYLDDRRGKAKVIVEVKPVTRSKKEASIQMQESAQMVAWIKSDGEQPSGVEQMRIIVSQDRHEIFLTVAKYGDEYIRYLSDKNDQGGSNSFMTMHQFGPWNTLDVASMKLLGPILLAISLRAEAADGTNTN